MSESRNEACHTLHPHHNTLQHTATHCLWICVSLEMRHATHCITPQHTATHCNTLQHTAFVYEWVSKWGMPHTASHCNTLHHTATHRNTLQHTAFVYKWVSKWGMSQVIHKRNESADRNPQIARMNESRHTHAWLTAHTHTNHGTHTRKSHDRHTQKWVTESPYSIRNPAINVKIRKQIAPFVLLRACTCFCFGAWHDSQFFFYTYECRTYGSVSLSTLWMGHVTNFLVRWMSHITHQLLLWMSQVTHYSFLWVTRLIYFSLHKYESQTY